MEIIKLIMELFKNDTKTKNYLDKRLTLDDDKFIEAALKARPTNRKLLDLKAEFEEEVSSGLRDEPFLEDEEVHREPPEGDQEEITNDEKNNIEDSGEYSDVNNDDSANDNVQSNNDLREVKKIDILTELQTIFATDSGTLKRINNTAVREGSGDIDQILLDAAFRARPKNAKLLKLMQEFSGEVPTVSLKETVQATTKYVADKVKEIVKGDSSVKVGGKMVTSSKSGSVASEEDDFNEDDFSLEREQDEIDNAKEDETKEKVLNDKVKSFQKDFEKIDVSTVLFAIFATDSGTLKRIQNAWKREETSEADLVEIALKARPKNAKLGQLIKDLAEEAELIEDQEDGIIEIGDDEALSEDTLSGKDLANDNPIPYIRNDNSNLTMFVNGDMKVINSEHPNFEKIATALEKQEWRSVFPMLDVRSAIAVLVHKKLEFKNDKLFYKGTELHGALVDKIIEMAKAGISDITPFMRFLHKLMKNPSERARDELFGFLASGKIPINERGNILTYKRINTNWTDCHSGTVDNTIGKTVTMGRSDVDSNKNSTCSNGLHVCSYSYLSSFGGGRTVVCEVNPRDVVSIPTDYKNAKMRCCKYTVLKEIKNDGPDVLSESPIYFDKK